LDNNVISSNTTPIGTVQRFHVFRDEWRMRESTLLRLKSGFTTLDVRQHKKETHSRGSNRADISSRNVANVISANKTPIGTVQRFHVAYSVPRGMENM
jgi:hypothetical protein